jgi:transcriptional antiterminator NusG
MFANKVQPEADDTVEEDGDVLTSVPPGAGDGTAEDAVAPLPGIAEEEQPEQSEEATLPDIAEEEQPEQSEEAALPDTAEEEEQPEQSEEAIAPAAQASEVGEVQTELAETQTEEIAAETETEVDLYEPQDSRAWYVVHCYSGYENKVKHNLEQRIETMQMQSQIFQVVVPTEDEIEVRDGKRRVVERRVFPGYILVQMLLNDDSWYVVRNTPGVTGFVGMGNEPTPLRSEEVQAIMKRMEAEAPKIKVTFKSGQKVRIIDGPFNEFIGMVDEIDMERAKVRVMVSFFGRETPVELDFLQVEKA